MASEFLEIFHLSLWVARCCYVVIFGTSHPHYHLLKGIVQGEIKGFEAEISIIVCALDSLA